MGVWPSGDGGACLTGDMWTELVGVLHVLVLELGLRR